MNYPIWELPAAGLLIALVAIVHVFISHFAIGGGLFLVLTERWARRDRDDELLAYLQRHSRVFALVSLVGGAVTGVGIWFTIALVQPQAVSSLINTFVWGWAIEWTFFVVEIAAAIVYYYGWTRLDARAHMAVGWVYFVAAWASLFIINGIITYMLTPGDWLRTRGFLDGFLNPTFWPSLVTRTLVAMGLAGLYALLTVSRSTNGELKARVARWAGLRWILPMAVVLPFSLLWYLSAAAGAGVPVAAILGAQGQGALSLLGAVLSGPAASGYPPAQRAALLVVVTGTLLAVAVLILATRYARRFGTAVAAVLMLLGILSMGGSEWVREDLRKPWVIDRFMLVNSLRTPRLAELPALPEDLYPSSGGADPFAIDTVAEKGALGASLWLPPPEGFDPIDGVDEGLATDDAVRVQTEAGRRVFRVECSACHTLDGYLAIRPLVQDRGVGALENILDRLAQPVDAAGEPVSWSHPELMLDSWRQRRMPPFVGTEAEEHALAMYLAGIGGADLSQMARLGEGEAYFDNECVFCHGPGEDWQMIELLRDRNRTADEYYELIGNLPSIDELMIDFEGTDAQRRAVAEYLVGLQEQAHQAAAEGGVQR